MSLVDRKAFDFAEYIHRHERRKHSNLPYIIHPYSVVKQLYDWGIEDKITFEAAILHDSIESGATILQLHNNKINDEVIDIVKELTYNQTQESKTSYLESFIDKRVESYVIKVADRIDNIQDFRRAKDPYVLKYIAKTEPIFMAILLPRIREKIIQKFGEIVYDNILKTITFYELNDRKS